MAQLICNQAAKKHIWTSFYHTAGRHLKRLLSAITVSGCGSWCSCACVQFPHLTNLPNGSHISVIKFCGRPLPTDQRGICGIFFSTLSVVVLSLDLWHAARLCSHAETEAKTEKLQHVARRSAWSCFSLNSNFFPIQPAHCNTCCN